MQNRIRISNAVSMWIGATGVLASMYWAQEDALVAVRVFFATVLLGALVMLTLLLLPSGAHKSENGLLKVVRRFVLFLIVSVLVISAGWWVIDFGVAEYVTSAGLVTEDRVGLFLKSLPTLLVVSLSASTALSFVLQRETRRIK